MTQRQNFLLQTLENEGQITTIKQLHRILYDDLVDTGGRLHALVKGEIDRLELDQNPPSMDAPALVRAFRRKVEDLYGYGEHEG
ncbi:MAG: hypothetical protein OEY44_00880 [Candidatus Peregrinibacteria bacterium]|nr:hypothetical protein [Candidatus Peregrinibacteria bacterium]